MIVLNIIRSNYWRTAVGGNPSLPARTLLDHLERRGVRTNQLTVLDFGAGRQRDKDICRQYFKSYMPYDIYSKWDKKAVYRAFDGMTPECASESEINNKYDIVMCNYVINIQPKEDRMAVFESLLEYLRKGSMVLISVRADVGAIKPNWSRFEDGFVTSSDDNLTFQKFYKRELNGRARLIELEEIPKLYDSHGFVTIDISKRSDLLFYLIGHDRKQDGWTARI